MSDDELTKLARRCEDMAASPNVPPAEQELWRLLEREISTYFAEER